MEDKYKDEYFVVGPEKEGNKEASAKLTEYIHNEFKDMFSGICCFEGTLTAGHRMKQTISVTPETHGLYATTTAERGNNTPEKQQIIIHFINLCNFLIHLFV